MASVLVVDDDAVSALVIARALGQAGHAVSVARSGLEALEKLQAGAFDALVTDWMMPDLDGLELIRKVQLRFTPAPVTIMVTCLAIPQAREHALESGAEEFVTKPVHPREVVEVLERCLSRRSSQDTTQPNLLVPFKRPRSVARVQPGRLPLVVIGANAGGPRALRILLRSLPPESRAAAFVVAQHAQARMIESLLAILQRETTLRVVIASHGQQIEPGVVLVAPGGSHVSVSPGGSSIELDSGPEVNHVRPSADRLFATAAAAVGSSCVGILLTGMGCDGTAGAARVRDAGGTVLVVTPGSHVAAGMLESALHAGVASSVVPLESMGSALGDTLQRLLASSSALPATG